MKRQTATLSIIILLAAGFLYSAVGRSFTGPTAAAVGPVTAITGFGKVINLNATSPEGCALTYEIVSAPANGTVSNLNGSTGVLVYTSNSSYGGPDSFTYHAKAFTTGSCTTGLVTSSAATVTINVGNKKTVVNGKLINLDGTAATGTITWSLIQAATTFDGFHIIQGSSVTRTLDSDGAYTVSLYPTAGLSPNSYYMAKHTSGSVVETLGIYNIPASDNAITQATLNTNQVMTLGTAQYVIASETAVEALASTVDGAAADAAASASAAAISATAAVNAALIAHNYDLIINNPGVSIPSQVFGPFPMNRSATFPITGSTCSAIVAATAQTDFVVQYSTNSGGSWTDKAILRYAASGKTCSLVSVTQINASSGDWIRIVGPSTPDATLSGFGFNIKGTVP